MTSSCGKRGLDQPRRLLKIVFPIVFHELISARQALALIVPTISDFKKLLNDLGASTFGGEIVRRIDSV